VLDAADLDEADRRLLRLLTEGYTNAEIAEQVGATRDAVGVQLAKLLARLGVSNRAEATTLAFKGFMR
jgi:DNA-binding NarL/FixJ family response regulator